MTALNTKAYNINTKVFKCSKELNPDLKGFYDVQFSSVELGLLHMRCSGLLASSRCVQRFHTSCRAHAHLLPGSRKERYFFYEEYKPRTLALNNELNKNNRNYLFQNEKKTNNTIVYSKWVHV